MDNFEHLIAAAPLVSELLAACPGLKALVTSRSPLRITGEHIMAMSPLTLPAQADIASPARIAESEAVRLFTTRAQAVAPSFALTETTTPLTVEICRRLDGLPLAIELAATRVNHLALPTMSARLDQRLSLLTGGASDLPTRQQTLRNAIGWSFDLLSPVERTLFARLSVFASGFTLAAEAIADIDGNSMASALDVITSLVDKSLVRHVPDAARGPRYELLETIREYAAEQLANRGDRDASRDRHAAFFQAFAHQVEPELRRPTARPWLERMEAEHDNPRAALARELRSVASLLGAGGLVRALLGPTWVHPRRTRLVGAHPRPGAESGRATGPAGRGVVGTWPVRSTPGRL